MELTHLPEQAEEVEPSPAFSALWTWALSHGVTCPKLKYPVKFGAGYLGAQAKEALGPLEAIVSVPRKLMLNIRSAEESEVAKVYAAHEDVFADPELEIEDLKIITYLLAELKKGRDSFWYYLIQSFDKSVEVLCDWTPAELSLLQDPEMIRESAWKLDYIQANYHRLHPILLKYPEVFAEEMSDFETFYWLWKTLSTRAFGKYNPSCSLVPLADLVNHAYCHSFYIIGEPDESVGGAPDVCVLDTSYQDPEKFPPPPKYSELLPITREASEVKDEVFEKMREIEGEIQAALDKEEAEEVWGGPWDVDEEAQPFFSIRTGTKEVYEAGSQLFLFYGHYSNRQLLLHYGFAMEENMYNYARLTLPLLSMTSNPHLSTLLSASGLDKAYFFSIREYEICSSLILKLRALNWTPDTHSPEAYFYPRDLLLEETIVGKAIDLLETELGRFPTSLEQDEEEKRLAGSIRTHFAIVYRMGVKKSIKGQIRLLSVLKGLISTVNSGEKSLFDALDSLPQSESFEDGHVSLRKSLSKYLSQLIVT